MDRCYLLVDVQEIRIQPYVCLKKGDYFFHFFWDTLYVSWDDLVDKLYSQIDYIESWHPHELTFHVSWGYFKQ